MDKIQIGLGIVEDAVTSAITSSPPLLAIRSRKPRTLVCCFDGTSNEYDADNTNVVKLFSLLKKDDHDEQLCYYQAGLGTWFNPGVVAPVFRWGAKVLDQAFAWYLDGHVIDGYKFLMQNYQVGDKICLFGFSRGAYTARALAGALFKVGLLPKDNESQVPFAYKLYKREDKEGIELCKGFKQTYCQDVKIEFMGVWDTVASVGVVMGRTLPFTNSNSSIKTFRHALSLDEHRAKFRPNRYHIPAPTEKAARADPNHASSPVNTTKKKKVEEPASPVSVDKHSTSSSSDEASGVSSSPETKRKRRFIPFRFKSQAEKLFHEHTGLSKQIETEVTQTDDVLEVWFAGCHTDVGGGAVLDSVTKSLSNVSLRWMVREVLQSGCGIQFNGDALDRLGINVNARDSKKQDLADALEEEHDELSIKGNVLWWLLEIIPLSFTCQDSKGFWHTSYGPNLGRGRKIYDVPKIHSSVKSRMEGMKYKPRAVYGSAEYVG